MQSDPRLDPAQQPRDPSVNPPQEAPPKDPAQSPRDPGVNPQPNPEKKTITALCD